VRPGRSPRSGRREPDRQGSVPRRRRVFRRAQRPLLPRYAGGKIVFEDYPGGHSRRQGFKIYSGTKGFWIVCALKAVASNVLSLDERVSETIPEWRNSEAKSRITVRQLLTFCSGLDAANDLHGDGFEDRNAIALRTKIVGPVGGSFIYGPAALQVFHEFLKRKLAPSSVTPTQVPRAACPFPSWARTATLSGRRTGQSSSPPDSS